MPRRLRATVFLTAMSLVCLLPLASAHGDEASSGLANYQVLGLASAASLLAYALIAKKLVAVMEVFTPMIFALAVFTGTVHILLGINDGLLLVGGIGVLGILLIPIIISMDERKTKFAQLALGGVAIAMFIGYFVSNHDPHYILEDYLGITTKLSEIALLVGIYKLRTGYAEKERKAVV